MYLIDVTENYRAETEAEAIKEIQKAKDDPNYILKKYSSTQKQIKAKGEVVEEYWKVSLTKVFDDEKAPTGSTTIEYNTDNSAF